MRAHNRKALVFVHVPQGCFGNLSETFLDGIKKKISPKANFKCERISGRIYPSGNLEYVICLQN